MTIQIYDHGIGIPNDLLERYNDLLRHPGTLTSESASRMGLTVVARLAQRLDIQVELRSGPSAGTVALVRLPSRLLPPAHAAILLRRDRELPPAPPSAGPVSGVPAISGVQSPPPLIPASALPPPLPPPSPPRLSPPRLRK